MNELERLAAYEKAIPFSSLDRATELLQADKDGRCKMYPPPAKEGDPKPECFYDGGGTIWCLGLAPKGDDEPCDRCKECWYCESGYAAEDRAEAEAALRGDGNEM